MADTSAATVPAEVPKAEQPAEKVVDDTPGIKLFIGNLSYDAKDDDLKKFMLQAVQEADILSHEVRFLGARPAGFGFVAVSTDVAEKAITELNGVEYMERKIVVATALSAEEKEKRRSDKKMQRRIGRRGSKAVTGEVTEAEANGDVAATGAEGENKPRKKRKSVKKFKRTKKASTTGENGAPAEGPEDSAAPTSEGEKKKAPRPKRTPKPRRAPGEEPSGEPSKTTLFVANLPFSLDEEGLKNIFKDFNVQSVSIPPKGFYKNQRSNQRFRNKGFGFVVFADEENQKKALERSQVEPFEAEDKKRKDDGKEGETEIVKRKLEVKVAVDPVHKENGAENAAGEASATEAAPAA
ncbi:uncharacterized protein FOMMEDRAFT_141777 [Fomitiporia mediterranea MF3/22]|uniref:uncharacterized protein n=1 Tax=Fomitiporia mediterranea (strain MF3/22) TaxID=694068 RepID=UPI0004409BA8|nr:uncharacterized protein FOMMEDRAFT_141777 [Fomitiporia mediterranea MF3/22]EJD01037.1 hypothetical protein FOMMEDRAFT_141777 [Fomitiporia mediterranea MF3/22]